MDKSRQSGFRAKKTEGPSDNWKELVRDPDSGSLVAGRFEPATISVPLTTLERLKAPTGMHGQLKQTNKQVRNPRAGQIIRDKK